jgi:hypothetical protein
MLVLGGAYGKPCHAGLWARTISRLAETCDNATGPNDVLVNLRRLPVCLSVYALAVGCVYRGNWGPLRTVVAATPATSRRGSEPLIARARPAAVLGESSELAGLVLEDLRRRDGLVRSPLNTGPGPPSAVVRSALGEIVAESLTLGRAEYTDLFDRTEVHLGLAAEYEAHATASTSGNRSGGWPGVFVHDGLADPPERWVERRVADDLVRAGDSWPPLRAGLLGGRANIAEPVAQAYLEKMRQSRMQASGF